MKALLLTLALVATAVNAEVLTIDVPAGDQVIEASTLYMTSGCSHKTTFLNVIQAKESGTNLYVVGNDLGIQNDDPVVVERSNRRGPIRVPVTCAAWIKVTTKAKFIVRGPKTIEIEVPTIFAGNSLQTVAWKTRVTPVKYK